jgi:thioredoxin-like negative regulator of GroEL
MTFGLPLAIEKSTPRIYLPAPERNMEKNKFTKIFTILAGLAFLGSSVAGLSGSIGSSMNEPAADEKAAQSQNAQLAAEEKGYAAVLQREPNNQTALKGLVSIRLRSGDVAGTRTVLAQLVKLNPTDRQYKELLAAIDKQVADTKKVGTLKPTEPTQPTQKTK